MTGDWSIVRVPPEGHEDVGPFVWKLFEMARDERERLGLPERWLSNFKLYRSDHWNLTDKTSIANKNRITANLFFSNVERTRANVTARRPMAEAVDLDGIKDGSEKTMTARLRKYWGDTNQQGKLSSSVLNNEIYGATIEKYYWDQHERTPNVTVLDIFSCFPAPGYYEDIAADCPYFCHAMPEVVEVVEEKYGVTDVDHDDMYSILGEARDEMRPIASGTYPGSMNAQGNYTTTMHPAESKTEIRERRALVVECWLRDYSTTSTMIRVKTGVDETGNEVFEDYRQEIPKYPGGIRKITITNNGKMVLDDVVNPNINPALPPEKAAATYGYSRFPFGMANSYHSNTDIWGFSAAEQTGDINRKIDELVSRFVAYANRLLFPPLIIPKGLGISRDQVNTKPNLVLMPDNAERSNYIRFVPLPDLPTTFFRIYDILMNLHDRVYMIEDVDRGKQPGGVIAASAIATLQDRNAVLLQAKVSATDYLVEQRGRWAISQWQNFGTQMESIEVEGQTVPFLGVEYAGRNYSYVVEAGSTMPRSSLQIREQSEKYYEMGAIDRQALLENTGFPDWRKVIERVGEGMLNQAIQVLQQAGLDSVTAAELKRYLMEPQGGPGGEVGPGKSPAVAKQGVPKAQQGKVQ